MKQERLQKLINEANEFHEFHFVQNLKSLASQFDQIRRDISVRNESKGEKAASESIDLIVKFLSAEKCVNSVE